MEHLVTLGIFFAGLGVFFIGVGFLWWISLYEKIKLPKQKKWKLCLSQIWFTRCSWIKRGRKTYSQGQWSLDKSSCCIRKFMGLGSPDRYAVFSTPLRASKTKIQDTRSWHSGVGWCGWQKRKAVSARWWGVRGLCECGWGGFAEYVCARENA